MVVDITKMESFSPPISNALFPNLAISLTAVGLLLAVWFFIFEVASAKKQRNWFKEGAIGLLSSLFLGFGVTFLFLWVGIYV